MFESNSFNIHEIILIQPFFILCQTHGATFSYAGANPLTWEEAFVNLGHGHCRRMLFPGLLGCRRLSARWRAARTGGRPGQQGHVQGHGNGFRLSEGEYLVLVATSRRLLSRKTYVVGKTEYPYQITNSMETNFQFNIIL